MGARQQDQNGFWLIRGNPLTKVGVFPYGAVQLGLDDRDPNEIVYVYRPESTLNDPETLASFQLLPLINDHTMLGTQIGGVPAERKGVAGVIGEEVYYDAPYMRATLKIFSEALKNAIESGKQELSLGYGCRYIKESGEFEGQPYEFIQVDMRGNHLALVDQGRAGSDVRVLDHFSFTCDSKLEAVMADENKPAETPAATPASDTDLASFLALAKTMMPQLKELMATLSSLQEEATEPPPAAAPTDEADPAAAAATAPPAERTGDEDPEAKASDEDPENKATDEDPENKAADADPENKPAAMDAATVRREAMDAVYKDMQARDALYKKVSPIIGAFDHAGMTADALAKYAVGKLGIKVAKGSEQIALDCYIQGRAAVKAAPAAKTLVAQDSAECPELDAYLKGEK